MTAANRKGNPAAERKGERLHASVRQTRILEAFDTAGFLSIADLAEELGVSGMTVRRDLTAMDKRGLLSRTHGGAVAIARSANDYDSVEPSFEQRMRVNADAKSSIAIAAARLVGPSESIGLDVGTSILALAEELAPRRDLRVFTNNLRVAISLAGGAGTVYVLAGQVRAPEYSVIGQQAVDALSSHFLHRVFLGVSGIDASGIYDYSPEDTEIKRAFMNNAERVCVLCDASKFGRRALSRIAALDRIDCLITDEAPGAELAEALAAAQVEIIVAG